VNTERVEGPLTVQTQLNRSKNGREKNPMDLPLIWGSQR